MIDINKIRHSLAHLLAIAILKYDDKAKIGIGPVIDNGFYYDFLFSKPFSEKELPNIEKEMRNIAKQNLPFSRIEPSINEAKNLFKDNSFKLEIIKDLEEKGEKITLYKTGNFIDLCKGNHVDNTSEIPDSFKLTRIAGAYWRGSEKNPMLTRIYGLAFSTEGELINYQKAQEEAKQRDHRILNEKLDIFMISDEIGKGLPMYLPYGERLLKSIEDFMYEQENARGYMHVRTPILTHKSVYEKSGHLKHYHGDMYPPIEIEGEEYYLRPMNCPHHHQIFKHKPRSYNDLPFRLAEFGDVYRFERSGVLTGLIRTRGFTQNDAHIYCSKYNLKDELKNILSFFREVHDDVFHIKDYWYRISLPDFENKEKYGDLENKDMWDDAKEFLIQALEDLKIKYVIGEGEAAFYGPKIDLQICNVNDKEDTIATIQIDFYSAKRFNLHFINNHGEKEEPIIIHHAVLGGFGRFLAFLVEQYKGEFPLWLCPVQVMILPITSEQNEYAKQVEKLLLENGFRTRSDISNNTLGKKIKSVKEEKIPYYLVIGKEEQKSNTITVESRSGKIGVMAIDDFINLLQKDIKNLN